MIQVFQEKEKQVFKPHITDSKSALKCCILLHFSSNYFSFFPFSPDLQVSLVTTISKNKTHMQTINLYLCTDS